MEETLTEHSSMESFLAVSDKTGEDSYTIIDRTKLEREMDNEASLSDWDLGQSLQGMNLTGKEKSRKNSTSSNEDEIENEIVSPPFSLLPETQTIDTQTQDALPGTEREPYSSFKKSATASSFMSQSVMEEKEDFIPQSKARSIQKHNKDLLIQNKKLSSMLTQEKQKMEEVIKNKDAENAILVKKVCELQDENDALIDNQESLATDIRSLKIALQVKSESLAARSEEVEYLTEENERLKKNLIEHHKNVERLKQEITRMKENAREPSAAAIPSGRSSEHSRNPREHQYHSSSSSQQRKERRDQLMAPQRDERNREGTRYRSSTRDTRPEQYEPEISSRAFESLRKPSAITECPVCGENIPVEKAIEMTQHVEECLRKKGYA